MTHSEHTPRVKKAIAELEQRRDAVLAATSSMLAADGGAMYSMDIFAIGCAKRAVSTSAGFKLLIEAWNLVCARVLLRTQVDTALRFSAAFFVSDPHEFCRRVHAGEQISKLKDREGQRLTDSYLVSRHVSEHPWISEVYKRTSGYVHLSSSHISCSVSRMDEEDSTFEMRIVDEDRSFPEFSWVETVDCFNAATDIFLKHLEGWTWSKDNPEAIAALREKRGNEGGTPPTPRRTGSAAEPGNAPGGASRRR